MNDDLALLVGRVILAFGALDQTAWSECFYLNADARMRARRKGGDMPEHGQEIDTRFAMRLKALRPLLSYYREDIPNILKDFDRVKNRITAAERKRAHLAHGVLQERDGRYEVWDAREHHEFAKRWPIATGKQAVLLLRGYNFEASRQPLEELKKRHREISYTEGDLRLLETEIISCHNDLSTICERAKSTWRETATPV